MHNPCKLYPVVNDTTCKRWCGPSIVSAITGVPMSAARAAFKTFVARALMGTHSYEVKSVLNMLGYDMRWVEGFPKTARPTLARWLREREPFQRSLTFAIIAGHHWIVVRGNKQVDSWKPEPTNIRQAPHRRRRVEKVWQVVKL